MSGLIRAGELPGRPVVTLGGEREAEIKDVVFERGEGHIQGFTLNNSGLFSRARKDALPISAVHGIGDAAVMIADAGVLAPVDDVAPKAQRRSGDVLADQVLTDDGKDLGTVVDVIVDLSASPPDVVGYEIEASEHLRGGGRRVLIPLPDTLAVSGEKLVVPAAVTEFVADDLASFAAAVTAFRKRIAADPGGSQEPAAPAPPSAPAGAVASRASSAKDGA